MSQSERNWLVKFHHPESSAKYVYFSFQRHVFEKTKKEFGVIDIVCNNAGIDDPNNWRKMIDINLVSHGINLCTLYHCDIASICACR